MTIIGSGPSGYTAGIYASRAMLNPLLFLGTNLQPGGQLMLTSEVENYPGFPDGIDGPNLMNLLKLQCEKFGTRLLNEEVTSVDFSKKPFQIKLNNNNSTSINNNSNDKLGLLGNSLLNTTTTTNNNINDKIYETESVIISTGAQSIWLNAENESKFSGKGISTCATCDGFFFKDQNVIVIGGGDSAMEEALFLTSYAKKVYIIHRRDVWKSSKLMYERAKSHEKIDLLSYRTIKKWISQKEINDINNNIIDDKNNDNILGGVILQDPRNNKEEVLQCDGGFIAIGHKPLTEFLDNQLELDENGYIKCINHTMTSIEGVFAAGDVVDHRYRQAITAAGMGCQAAMDAEKYLTYNHL